MPRFRMRNIKALLILNIEKMNFFKKRSKCITFVGIDHIYRHITSIKYRIMKKISPKYLTANYYLVYTVYIITKVFNRPVSIPEIIN